MAQQLGVGAYFRGPRLKSQDSSQPSTISVLDAKPSSGPLRHCMHMVQTYMQVKHPYT